MKPILNDEDLPKFLMVNNKIEKRNYNKYLLTPYAVGEIVKVASPEQQVRCKALDDYFKFVKPNDDISWFKQRYVVIYRKDKDGKFSHKCSDSWEIFDYLKRKNNDKK